MTTSSYDAPSRTMPAVLILVLGLLTAVPPLATDLYLPAFPAMADDLGTSAASIQLTLTAFLVGMGVGQLVIGPLSDAIGRRRPVLWGTVICLLATVLCAVAPTVEVLTAARLVQGLGGAAGVVLARAMISDRASGAVAAKILGVLMIITVVAPVIAPLLGSVILGFAGWRAVFWVLAVLVLLMLVLAIVLAEETLPVEERQRGGLAAAAGSARELLGNRFYTGYLLTFCFAFAGLFAYISASPFVVQNVLGFSESGFALVFGLNALAIMVTSAVAASLAGKVPFRRMIAVGLGVTLVASIGLLVSTTHGTPSVATLLLMALFQASLGLTFGNATALALQEAGQHAGTGSAFLGFLQFTLAALMAPLVGISGEDTGVPMAVAMVVSTGLAVGAFVWLTRGHAGEVLDDPLDDSELEGSAASR